MRSTIIAAAFAATALAVPYANPEVVTAYNTDVVYVTNVVTVTEGAQAPATTVAAADAAPTYESQDQGSGNWGGNGGWHWPHKHKSKKTKTRTRTRTPTPAPSPPPSYETSTWEEPDPTATPEPEPEPTTSESQPEPTQAPPSGLTSYNDIVIEHHNVHRQNHSVSGLEWDDALAATAQKIAAGCVYAHDTEKDGGGYGQNIAAGVEAANVSIVITDMFYNGEVGYFTDLYGQAQPDMTNFHLWGHFSQIVWENTKTVGCATQYCSGGLGNVGDNVPPYFTVCNYGPPGNYANEYADNVKEPLNRGTVGSDYGM